MKRAVLMLIVMAAWTAQARVWKVDNNAGHEADFRTLQSAHDSANVLAGDTLYVAPSAAFYGDLKWTKRLSIIGPGYFLDQNFSYPYMVGAAKVDTITLTNGCDGSILASMTVSNVVLGTVSNITIKRNRIFIVRCINGTRSAISILQNYLGHVSGNHTVSIDGRDITIANNILLNNYGVNVEALHLVSFSGRVVNNVIICGNGLCGSITGDSSCYMANNVITQGGGMTDSSGSVIKNNVTSASTFPGTDNILSVSSTSLFVSSTSPDGCYQLSTNSPAHGAGVGGIDCGIFGGSSPYVLSGLPALPVVTGISAPISASDGSGLPVTVTIRMTP